MKLLLLTRYGRMGASSRYRLMQYVPLFERAGHEVVVQSLLDDAYLRQLYTTGVRPASSLAAGYARRLWRSAMRTHFDAVICEQEAFPYLPSAFEHLVFRRFAPRVYFDYDDAAYVRYGRIPILRNKIGQLMAAADSVVVGNRYLAAYARNFSQRVTVVPSVINLAQYPKRRTGHENGTVRVVWIGTPITARMLEPLLPIFERLQRKYSQVLLRLIGAGSCIAKKTLRCETPDWSEESEAKLLAESDIGIMPLSDSEFARGKCGLKLIQYMASGLPVVASPVGVNPEIVQHGCNGYLASSPEEWEDALRSLIEGPGLRVQMGQAGRQVVENEYTLEHGFAKWMEVLEARGKHALAQEAFWERLELGGTTTLQYEDRRGPNFQRRW